MTEHVDVDLPPITEVAVRVQLERGPGGKPLRLPRPGAVRGYLDTYGSRLFGWMPMPETGWWDSCIVDLTGAIPVMICGRCYASEDEARDHAVVAYFRDSRR